MSKILIIAEHLDGVLNPGLNKVLDLSLIHI